MNSPRKFAAVLLASSGLALAVSLVAQSTAGGISPGTGKSANAGNKGPVPNQPINPNPAPHDPTVSAVPAEPKTGSGLTPGAANSGSGPGGRETVAPASTTPPADVANPGNHSSIVDGPGAHGFSTLDTDRDGRISLTEFGSPSAAWLRAGAPGAGINNDDSVVGKPAPSSTMPGPRDVTGRPVAPGNSSNVAGPHSAAANAQLFQQLDMDHDGYLSPAEVAAYRAPTPLER
jgi:hypothetical protein